MTWKAVHDLTKKPIIADDGYGVASASIGHDSTWDLPANLNARIGDGVVAITQANPRPDWNGVIAGVRGQLQAVACGTRIRWDGKTGFHSKAALINLPVVDAKGRHRPGPLLQIHYPLFYPFGF